PNPLQSVFPYNSAVADEMLGIIQDKTTLLDPVVLRSLHRYGIQFNADSYLRVVPIQPVMLPVIYPLLRHQPISSSKAFSDLDVLIKAEAHDLDLVQALVHVPEFALRIEAGTPGFLTALEPAFRNRQFDLEFLINLPNIDDIVNTKSSQFGQTLLHYAFENGRMEFAKQLLDLPNIDVGIRNIWNRTPIRGLHCDSETVNAFLTFQSLYPKLRMVLYQNLGEFVSVLNEALSDAYMDVVMLALSHPLITDLVNVRDWPFRRTLLQCAFEKCRLGTVKVLLQVPGIDVNVTDKDGHSAIYLLPHKYEVVAQFIDLLQVPEIKYSVPTLQIGLCLRTWSGDEV
ncbi:hypothetical protein BVRB_018630, partial [Beta vulgaris subsp. vulgaris]